VEHDGGQRIDQARALGQRYENLGGDRPAHRVRPPHERLDGADPAGTQIQLRLVPDLEVAPLQSPPQVAHQSEPVAAGGFVHRLEAGVRLAEASGAVLRQVRAPQQQTGRQLLAACDGAPHRDGDR